MVARPAAPLSAAGLLGLTCLAPPAPASAQCPAELLAVCQPGSAGPGSFGRHVSADGDRLAVGDPDAGGPAPPTSGLVHVFERTRARSVRGRGPAALLG